jgi:adhesin/invasin
LIANGTNARRSRSLSSPLHPEFCLRRTTRAIASNQDGVLNSPETPESRGPRAGVLRHRTRRSQPPVPTGEAAPLDRLSHAAPVTATVGGVTVQAFFAGLTPGFVGLGQVNLIIPENAPHGDAVPVIIQGSKAATVSIR